MCSVLIDHQNMKKQAQKCNWIDSSLFVVDLDGNPAVWQHNIVEMLACAWHLSLDSVCQQIGNIIKAFQLKDMLNL
jgi:hypothetical protein